MKMKLYYVVKKNNGLYEEVDWDYVAGPFSFEDAWSNKNVRSEPRKFTIVEQIIEVGY